MNALLLPGRHAVVVGASSKIALAIAGALAERGLVLTGLSRTPPAGAPFARTLKCDAGSPLSLEEALLTASEDRPIDVLIYAAGAPAMGITTAVPESVAREAFEVGFWGLDRAVRTVVPGMMNRRRGAVLAVLSIAALRAVPHEAYYAATKAAAARYLECVAYETRKAGVSMHYVAPGFIDTGFFASGGWFGMAPPRVNGSGVTPQDVAAAAMELLGGADAGRVIGWRERAIVLADRVAPGLYDRWLARRSP